MGTDLPRPGARGWARAGLYGGLLLSLAGNEAHVWGDGYPGWGPAVASIVWPGLLFVALEIVLHMGPGFRWAKWVGLGSVAAVSGAVSYWHLSSVLHSWHYGLLSWFGSLAIDGLMVMSTVVLTRLVAADVPAPVPVPVPVRTPLRVFAGPQSIPSHPVLEVHPVPVPQSSPPEKVRPAKPADPQPKPEPVQDGLPQGVHVRAGRALRGLELRADAVSLVRTRGLSNAELAEQYTPPLRSRKAEEFGAEARKVPARVNGNAPDIAIP
jgi:hypothetical protein